MSNVKIKYRDVAVDARQSFQPSASEQGTLSNVSLLAQEDVVYKDFSNPCEFYSFFLDGKETPLPQNYESENYGFVSAQIADENGEFATPIVLTFTASANFTSTGISLTFDVANGIYASLLNIKWYRGSELLSDANFTPNSPVYFCENRVDFYNKIVITFYGTSVPYNRLKVREIEYGLSVEFDGGELRNAKAIQEVDPVSTQISINTVDFTIETKRETEFSFQTKQPVSVFFNGELIHTGFVKTSERTGKGAWNIQSEDYIGLLDSVPFYGGIYSNKNAVGLLDEIAEVSKVRFDVSGDFANSAVTGYIPYTTCREALKQIAFAIGAAVDTSNSNAVKVFKIAENVSQEIPASRMFTGQKISTGTRVTAVEVVRHVYRAISDTAEAYNAAEGGTGNGIFVQFSEPLHSLSITNGTMVESGTNYAIINANSGCILSGKKYKHEKITHRKDFPLVTYSDVENVVAIENATLVSSANIDTVLQRCYDYFTVTEEISARIIDGRHETEDGSAVYDKKTSVGDMVGVETEYAGIVNGRIIRQSFGLNGGVLVKDTTLKKIAQ
jgi:hypothetical protein